MAGLTEKKVILAAVARPLLRQLGRHSGRTVHLGVLEDDMVTYVVKEGSGGPAFTREGMQLEAYCSGIGKILLAHLPPEILNNYLDGGPFIPMTANTLTEPEKIREELNQVRVQGYALDRAEAADGLYCVAVPIHDAQGQAVGALSMSDAGGMDDGGRFRPDLIQCAQALSARLLPFADCFAG